MYPRFRGRHRLWRHENGLEKCVGCSLCAAACPADCIRVVPAENTPDNRVSAGERYARIYEINMSRCIFCGYCELACPFDAITLGNEYEISEYNRDDQIYTKDMLLAEPIKKIPVADARPLRHADPLLQGQQLIVASRATSSSGSSGSPPRSRASPRASRVVSFRNPFYSALALIGNLGSLAVLYLLLSAEFVAAAQVLVYAGAVMVMFLFVIAYLGGEADAPFAGRRRLADHRRDRRGGGDPRRGHRRDRRRRPAARLSHEAEHPRRPSAAPREIGRLFLTDHLLAFEVTSIVLLAAAVGGVVLGHHSRTARAAWRMLGPDVTWYLAVSAILFAIGALGVLLRRSPLIVLLSLEIMLNGGNLALIAFSRHNGEALGPGVRDRRDGGRGVRGRRRPRADRRDVAAAPPARRRPAADAPRLTA